jgi:hypothetical protein
VIPGITASALVSNSFERLSDQFFAWGRGRVRAGIGIPFRFAPY